MLLLPIRPLKDRERVRFCIKDPLVKWDDLFISEEEVEVFKAVEMEHISSVECRRSKRSVKFPHVSAKKKLRFHASQYSYRKGDD